MRKISISLSLSVIAQRTPGGSPGLPPAQRLEHRSTTDLSKIHWQTGVMPTLQAPALVTLKFLVVSLAFLRTLQIRPVEPTMQSAARSMMAFLGQVLKIYFR